MYPPIQYSDPLNIPSLRERTHRIVYPDLVTDTQLHTHCVISLARYHQDNAWHAPILTPKSAKPLTNPWSHVECSELLSTITIPRIDRRCSSHPYFTSSIVLRSLVSSPRVRWPPL